MDKLYIGLAGQMLSGKGTAAKFFVEKFDAQHFNYSANVLNPILMLLDLPFTRQNQQDLGKLLREQFGKDVLSNSLLDRVKEAKKNVVVIEGIRTEEEADAFRQLGDFILVFIDADIHKRFERLQGRSERAGESEQTFEEFQSKHDHQAEANIAELKNHADYVVKNDGTLEEFEDQLIKVITRNK